MAARPGKSLFVRNLALNTRTDDLRRIFDKYGSISDVYMPLDYHTRQPRGFAYVQFDDPRDADEAMYGVRDGVRVLGRDLDIEFAKGDRKDPRQMRAKESGFGRGRYNDRYSRSPDRRRRRSYSRSPSPGRRHRSRSPRRSYSPRRRSRSPYSRSSRRSPTPPPRSRSPPRHSSPPRQRRHSRSPSP